MELVLIVVIALIVYYVLRSRSNGIDTSVLPEQFVVFDLETTGLDPQKHSILEIGAIKISPDYDRHPAIRSLVKPPKKIPAKITKITGITQAEVDAEGEPLETALKEFLDFIGDLRLVAYNADFDMGFLREACETYGYEITNPVSCALKMARRAFPGLKSYKLSEISKAGELDTTGSHRALKDCELTAAVYVNAASMLKSVE